MKSLNPTDTCSHHPNSIRYTALSKLKRLAVASSCLVIILLASGCQKADEPQQPEAGDSNIAVVDNTAVGNATEGVNDTQATAAQQVAVVETDSAANSTDTPPLSESVVDSDDAADPNVTDTAVAATNNAQTPNTPVPGPDPEVAVIGTQISNVTYKNSAGKTLEVIYKTSPKGELTALVTLPSGKKATLTAPEGQGNNPTYRSTNGKLELVSHQGGGSVDLIDSGNSTKYTAVNAAAEVIPQ